ncbi:chorismate mutase [Pseudonocardia sp.]|uniref:chorismate mutase n=1 Tax=Pseudonocardia sp. TaxID=60912 RepID=UPI003D0F2D64
MSVTTEQSAPSGNVAPTQDTADDAANIDGLRREIDRLDAEILRLVRERTDVSRRIGAVRMAGGGPRIVYSREIHVLARFRELGEEGRELAMLLLRLGRGRLGGR